MPIFFSGLLAGLSVGVFCVGFCLPIFIPYLLAEERTARSSFRAVLEFSLGRLLGYLTFGGAVGFLGEKIQSGLIHRLSSLATILMALVMIFYSLGLLRWPKVCKRFAGRSRIPIILGFLTGVNICPPFLASLSYVFNLRSAFSGMLYFLAFFLGTSAYIIPAGLLGFFSRKSRFQKIARLSGVLIGIYFLISAFNLV